jgi:hypothetical protein
MEKKNRVTKSQRLSDIKALLLGEEVSFGTTLNDALTTIDHELELLAKKNSGSSNGEKKLTATQVENENFKNLILDFLGSLDEESDGATCTEILQGIPELSNYQVTKVSGLIHQLCPACERHPKGTGQVVYSDIKGKRYFRLA